jgi:hypothetical protein
MLGKRSSTCYTPSLGWVVLKSYVVLDSAEYYFTNTGQ